MRAILVILPLLGGCVLTAEPVPPALSEADLSPAALAFELLQPDQALALLEDPSLWLPVGEGCPSIHVDDDGVERWQGGCTLADGTLVIGDIERFVGPESTWVAGNGLHVIGAAGRTRLYFDGAVEWQGLGELSGIEAAYSACGLLRDCEQGPTTVDLALNLYPHAGYPVQYDLAVEGVVAAAGLEPTPVSGALSFDLEACPVEPASGSLLLHGSSPWGLDFDGATACDACADVAFEGLPMGLGCTGWLAWAAPLADPVLQVAGR